MRDFANMLAPLRAHPKDVIGALVALAVMVASAALIPILLGDAINEIEAGNEDLLVLFSILVVAVGLLRVISFGVGGILANRLGLGVEYDLRQRFLGHVLGMDWKFFRTYDSGQLVSRATADTRPVRIFIATGLFSMIRDVMTLLTVAVIMLVISPLLAALALLPLVFTSATAVSFWRRSRPALQEAQQRLADLTAIADEDIAGVTVIKAFAREQEQRQRFRAAVTRLFRQQMRAARVGAVHMPLVGLLPQIGLAIILGVGGRMVIDGDLTLGHFFAFFAYVMMLVGPARHLGVVLQSAQRATAGSNRIAQILATKSLVSSPPDASDLPEGLGKVMFTDVSSSFKPGRPVLDSVSLSVDGGHTVALVGSSGAGKSVLVTLLNRMLQADSGSLTIDGADVTDVDLGSVRRAVKGSSDDPFIFNMSVADNIAYGRPDATDQAIAAAARLAGADQFIANLSKGYQTILGPEGTALSGGQAQRVALARAVLAQPRILVLDNATSGLDADTEAKVFENLEQALGSCTAFVVASRPAMIIAADQIVVMERGQIVGVGQHEELVANCRAYRAIVASWDDEEPGNHWERGCT